ncbi:MAG: hypothetical protein LBR20_03730, partial [Propionibacteriaceae bacterium]|nr:hypothetical protein [Propionibacteriaceae bacterium]
LDTLPNTHYTSGTLASCGWTAVSVGGTHVLTVYYAKKPTYNVDFLADNGGTLESATGGVYDPFEIYRVADVVEGTAWSEITVPTPVPDPDKCFTGWAPDFPDTVTRSLRFTATFGSCPPVSVKVEYRLDSDTGTLLGNGALGTFNVGSLCAVPAGQVIKTYTDAAAVYTLDALPEAYDGNGFLVDCTWTVTRDGDFTLTVWFGLKPVIDPTDNPTTGPTTTPTDEPSPTPTQSETPEPSPSVTNTDDGGPQVPVVLPTDDPSNPNGTSGPDDPGDDDDSDDPGDDDDDDEDLAYTGFNGAMIPLGLAITVFGAVLVRRGRRD